MPLGVLVFMFRGREEVGRVREVQPPDRTPEFRCPLTSPKVLDLAFLSGMERLWGRISRHLLR